MSFLAKTPPTDGEGDDPNTDEHLPQVEPGISGEEDNMQSHPTALPDNSIADMDTDDEHSSITDTHATHTDFPSEYEDQSMFIDEEEHDGSDDELCEIDKSGVSEKIKKKWNDHKFVPDEPVCEITAWGNVKTEPDDEKPIVIADAPEPQARSHTSDDNRVPQEPHMIGSHPSAGASSASRHGSAGLEPSEEIARLKARLAHLEGKVPSSGHDADPQPDSAASGSSRPSTHMNEHTGIENDNIHIEHALNDGEVSDIQTQTASEPPGINQTPQTASKQGQAQPKKRMAGMSPKNRKPSKRRRTRMGFGNNLKTNRRRKQSDFTGERMLELLRPINPFETHRELGNIHGFEASTIEEQINKIRDEIKGDPNADLARVNREIQDLATARSQIGRNRCRAAGGKWKVAGIQTPLFHYQLWGLGWMLEREKEDDKIHGGVLADDVGLGKTLQALSLVVADLQIAVDKNPQHKGAPTLIVAPPGLLWQWQDEVQKHCPQIVHLTYREKDEVKLNVLERMDIVFITYHELLRNYPPIEAINHLNEQHLPPKDRRQKFNEAAGVVYNCKWRRVIFDEAHAMKNIRTITSKACLELGERAKHRWALTGTPIPNGVKELVPYMKLIQAPCPRALKCYNSKDAENPRKLEYHKALEELAPLVARTILKRNVMTLFLGRALFDLPKAHQLPNSWLSFSKEEMHIYSRIEDYFRGEINKQSTEAAKFIGRIPAYLAWALRLRQATAHPFLLESLMRDFLTIDDIKKLRKELRKIGAQTRLLDHWRQNMTAEDQEDDENGSRFDMDPQLKLVVMVKEAMCKSCQDLPMDPVKTDCGHIFCGDCLQGHLDTEDGQSLPTHSCPECEGPLTGYKPTVLPAALLKSLSGGASIPTRTSTSSSAMRAFSASRREGRPRGPGDDLNGLQPTSDVPSSFVTMCDENRALALESSAKTTVVRDIIIDTLREHPDDKLIVFTQWTTIGRILGRILDAEKIGYYYLFGCFGLHDKKKNIRHFHENPEASVLIAGLKCGGQGLNLTCANRVINIDLWWNYAVEQQAFGRVFRMGQTKETYLHRIMVKNSIDGRMLKLQERKLKEINAALKDYDPAKQRLSESDVAGLFGRITRKANGQLVVERDYEDEEDTAYEGDTEPYEDYSEADEDDAGVHDDNNDDERDEDSD